MPKAKKEVDYYNLAAERGFEWLGPAVNTTRIKTWWQCERGHRWAARYSNIQQGSGCPACAGKARRTAEDYRILAAKRGFE